VSDSDGSTADKPAEADGVTNAAPVEESSSSGSDDGPPAPTPQSAALRRQQFYVGLGGVIIGGLAVAVILLQRFPDAPVVLPVLGGVAGAGIVLWLVRKSLFPTEQTVSSDE
jgi:hypothetical protein